MSRLRLRMVPEIAEFADVEDAAWRTSGPFATPRKLAADRGADPRWLQEFVVAFDGDEPAGILALYRPKNGRAADPTYDLRSLTAQDGSRELAGLDRPIYIGGCRDFETGWAVSSRLPKDQDDQMGAELISFAVRHALDQGCLAVALYVRDMQAQAFRTGFGPQVCQSTIADEAAIVLGFPDFSGYVAALPASHRSIVRRDLRRFAQSGLRSDIRPAQELIRQAGPLVAAVKIKHGLADHPQLAAFRLESWIRGCPGQHVAFVITDESRELLCVSFACGYRETLTLYEIGMPEAAGQYRHLAYVHALVYAPVEYALEYGYTCIRLGLAVGPAKTFRGAVATPMWAFISRSRGV